MRSWYTIALFAAVSATASVSAQDADIASDLANLKVRHRTEHYALGGTVSDGRFAEYGRCLEFIYKEYAGGFAELLEGKKAAASRESAANRKQSATRQNPGGEKTAIGNPSVPSAEEDNTFQVIVYAKDDEYRQFSDKYFSGSLEHTQGAYVPSLSLLVIRDDPNSNETYETLFHEAFHQFAHKHIPLIPIWVDEGLATYYGNARPTNTGLVFDRPAGGYFRIVREARDEKLLFPLNQLMAMTREEFYRKEPVGALGYTRQNLCYAQAYTLVAYILKDKDGARHLRQYLKELAAAKTPAEAGSITQRSFNQKLPAVTNEWLSYCDKH